MTALVGRQGLGIEIFFLLLDAMVFDEGIEDALPDRPKEHLSRQALPVCLDLAILAAQFKGDQAFDDQGLSMLARSPPLLEPLCFYLKVLLAHIA